MLAAMRRTTVSLTPKRRKFLEATGALSVAATAGCRTLMSPNSGEGRQGDGVGNASDVPDDLFKGETLTIGALYPYPGDYRVATDAKRTMDMAVKEHNRENGVLGADLEVIHKSTRISPAVGRRETKKLIQQHNADVIIGGFLGETFNQMMKPVSASKEVLAFYPGSGNPRMATETKRDYDNWKYYFRSIEHMEHSRQSIRHHVNMTAKKLGWDRVAVFTEEVPMVDVLGEKLVKNLRNDGVVDVPLWDRTSTSITNWKPLFDQVEQANCDACIANLVLTGMTAARQWGTSERPFDFGGIHVFSMSPQFWQQVGRVCPSIWTLNLAGHDSFQTPRTIPFQDRFEEMFGYRTSAYLSFTYYDAINMWVHAIKNAGSLNPEDLIPYLERRTWKGSVITKTQNFHGPDHKWPHDWEWNGWSTEGWNQEGWLPFTQWQGEKGGEAQMVTASPPRSAGGKLEMVSAPWNR